MSNLDKTVGQPDKEDTEFRVPYPKWAPQPLDSYIMWNVEPSSAPVDNQEKSESCSIWAAWGSQHVIH